MNLIKTASVRFIIEINMTIDDIQNITSKLKNDLIIKTNCDRDECLVKFKLIY